jgi:hypothetical protein
MFGSSDGQRLAPSAPAGALGPRYEVAFRVPGGAPTPDVVRQDLYPLASGGPVTYTPPDQTELAGHTTGGWYRAPDGFAALLTRIGIPGTQVAAATSAPASPAPASRAADRPDAAPATLRKPAWTGVLLGAVLLVAVAVAIAVVAIAVVAVARRRGRATS